MKYLLIFLMCVQLLCAKTNTWVVGGAGTGANKAATNGGGYDDDVIDWDDCQGVNGAALGFDANGTVDNNGGNARVTGDGDDFDNVVAGVMCVCDFAEDEHADGYYLVSSVDGGDAITLDLTFAGDGEAVDIVCGGALAAPGDVPDTDDGAGEVIGGNPTVNTKVWVRALADYTADDESDSVLYVNAAGTAGVVIVWEGHFAALPDSGVGDFGIATLDGTTATNCIETAVGGNVYHVFIGFSLELAGGDGANLNTVGDSNVTFIRCQFVNNTTWGIQGDNDIGVFFCDFDNNGGGLDGDNNTRVIASIFRNNDTNHALVGSGLVAINNVVSDQTTARGIVAESGPAVLMGNTVDMNNQGGSIGILQDSGSTSFWTAMNNIITDCVTGIQDDATLRERAVLYFNLYNSNTTDAQANITPQPVDGDNFGNLVKNVAENVLWTADDQTYILQSAFKESGVDGSYTRAYWDDFNGGAGDNPPSPLLGLSFMDNGAQQRIEAGGGVAGFGNKSGGKQ